MGERLIRVVSPSFVAGAVLKDGTVSAAAPILGYMKGWSLFEIQWHCVSKGWSVEKLSSRSLPNENRAVKHEKN